MRLTMASKIRPVDARRSGKPAQGRVTLTLSREGR
jgi:hypothetical protein